MKRGRLGERMANKCEHEWSIWTFVEQIVVYDDGKYSESWYTRHCNKCGEIQGLDYQRVLLEKKE